MRLFAILLMCFFLVSCNSATEENYFDRPRDIYVTYRHGDVTLEGRLVTDGEAVTFYPDRPEGVRMTLDGEGGSTELEGMEFKGGITELSRLKPLLDAIGDGSITQKNKDLPKEFSGKGFTLTVHKEITQ